MLPKPSKRRSQSARNTRQAASTNQLARSSVNRSKPPAEKLTKAANVDSDPPASPRNARPESPRTSKQSAISSSRYSTQTQKSRTRPGSGVSNTPGSPRGKAQDERQSARSSITDLESPKGKASSTLNAVSPRGKAQDDRQTARSSITDLESPKSSRSASRSTAERGVLASKAHTFAMQPGSRGSEKAAEPEIASAPKVRDGEFEEIWQWHLQGKLVYVVVVGSVLTSFYVSADAEGAELYRRAKLDASKMQLVYRETEIVSDKWRLSKVKDERIVLTAREL